MGRVRVFYGHEGIVPPTGYRARSAAAPAAPEADVEVDEIVAESLEGEPVELVGEVIEDGDVVEAGQVVRVDGSEVPVGDDGIPVLTDADEVDEQGGGIELPDDSWTGPELDAFAEEKSIDLTGAKKTKADKLARILETLKEK